MAFENPPPAWLGEGDRREAVVEGRRAQPAGYAGGPSVTPSACHLPRWGRIVV